MFHKIILVIFVATGAAAKSYEKATEERLFRNVEFLLYEFCANRNLTCVLDLTSPPPQCEFSFAVSAEVEKADLPAAKSIFEKQCAGYRWRVVDQVHVFEPRKTRSSHLNRKVAGIRSEDKVTPDVFLFMLVEAAGIQLVPAGSGAKPRQKEAIHFSTPSGTLKSALISAAKQYPKTVWSVVSIEDAHRIFAL
ncbi:MAG: hypothetical protein SF051_04530 [Elusimicrobiota bacterium]|nr:hypothetical protein [Elusimicrobiota bacterium]